MNNKITRIFILILSLFAISGCMKSNKKPVTEDPSSSSAAMEHTEEVNRNTAINPSIQNHSKEINKNAAVAVP